jgi:hypothetical protein
MISEIDEPSTHLSCRSNIEESVSADFQGRKWLLGRGSCSARVRRLLTISLAVVYLLSTTGCYIYHVYQTGGPDGREMGNAPSTEWRHKTLHAFAWGAVRQDLPVDNCQLANGQRFGIEEVKIETNLGYVIISALTFGLWVPLDVSWRCAKPPIPTGVLH